MARFRSVEKWQYRRSRSWKPCVGTTSGIDLLLL
ncbi:hypothetical protein F383_34099 [Gossypium arboreum]|uniref:Uncharacterized protein n=1 Tax=Gossypium arboreum TaxID=29729 RepID=A0A0B0PSQ3_GOSAR|nr:hypothetical protein F383_34099 [Gossypium arboreum]